MEAARRGRVSDVAGPREPGSDSGRFSRITDHNRNPTTMAKTQITDVIVPDIWVPYMIERTATKSRLIQSGIVERDPQFDALANADGGRTVNMPFWTDLTGADEVLDDSGSLTPGKMASSKDVAAINWRGKAWSHNDLAKHLAGDDPAAAVADLVGEYWNRRMQAFLNSALNGVFAAASMATNNLDLHVTTGGGLPTSANILSGITFLKGKQLLGDSKDKLVAIVMHSAVETQLLALDLIDYAQDSEGKMTLKTFQGLEVICDDNLPVEEIDGKLVFHTFLFGRGAFGLGMGRKNDAIEGGHGTWEVEFSREALAGDSYFINRRKFILHPRGIKWADASVAANTGPTNAELEDASNWTRVFEQKNVRIVRIRHNVLPM